MTPGDVFKHFKGGEYVIIAKAQVEATMQEVVVYQSRDGKKTWIRPVDEFLETIEREGITHQRFQKIDESVIFIDQYQELASRTASKTNEDWQELVNHSLGIAGEAGETAEVLADIILVTLLKVKLYGRAAAIADFVKKIFGHGHPFDDTAKKKIAKELGDVKWYTSMLCRVLKLKESEVATMNIKKLKERYPEGFSVERSLNRAEG